MSQMQDTPRDVAAGAIANSSSAGQAAAGVLGDVLDEIAHDKNMDVNVRKAAVDHLTNLGSAAPAAAPPMQTYVVPQNAVSDSLGAVSAVVDGLVPNPQAQAVAPAAQPAETQTPTLGEPDIPADVLAWLEEDDVPVDDDLDDEPTAAVEETDDDEDILDDDVRRERTARIKAERKAEHFKNLRTREARGKWVAEVQKSRLTLTDGQLQGITADSRRGFWREAKALHDTNIGVLQQLGVDPAQAAAQAADEARTEARAEAQAAWGKPMVAGPAPTPPKLVAQQEYVERVQRARRGSSFPNLVKTLMFPDRP